MKTCCLLTLNPFQSGMPGAGGVEEAFTCPEQGVLHVTSTVTVGGQSETTLQVLPFLPSCQLILLRVCKRSCWCW